MFDDLIKKEDIKETISSETTKKNYSNPWVDWFKTYQKSMKDAEKKQ